MRAQTFLREGPLVDDGEYGDAGEQSLKLS